jgi:lipopolysaccharide/colanic/teichoic acid biosynthesis glycosyltransferase
VSFMRNYKRPVQHTSLRFGSALLKPFVNPMYQARLLLAELFLIAFATATSLVIINNFEISVAIVAGFAPYLLLTLVTAIVILPSLRTYRSIWRLSGLTDFLRIVAATGAIVVGAVALSVWFNSTDGSVPALPVLQGLLILFFLVGVRVLMRLSYTARERSAQRKAAGEARGDETILVVGLSRLTDLYLRFLAQFEPHQVRIGGLLGDTPRQIGCSVHGHPILETPEQIAGVLSSLEYHGVVIDRIVVTTPFERLSPEAQGALLDIKKSTNIDLELLADELGIGRLTRIKRGLSSDGTINGVAVSFICAEDIAALARRPYWRVKRVLEPVAALGLLIVLAPLFVLVAALTLIDVGLPWTFWQRRPGLNGRQFKLYKFRSMAPAYDANGRRVPEEERTSAIGHFLRCARLDELPQLFHIVFGEMSFIGPRPLLPIDQPAAYAARLLVRPGLTGWAQVKGGRAISPADKAALDIWYVRNASLVLDLKILALTVPMLIFGEKVDTEAIRLAWKDLGHSTTNLGLIDQHAGSKIGRLTLG